MLNETFSVIFKHRDLDALALPLNGINSWLSQLYQKWQKQSLSLEKIMFQFTLDEFL